MKHYLVTFIIIAVLAWGYFRIIIPMQDQFSRVGRVAATYDTFGVWVENITSMETDYDKILREGKD